MTALLHPIWVFAVAIGAAIPIGLTMARALDPAGDRVGRGFDALPLFLCRLMGKRQPAEMSWKQYCIALLAFNLALFVLTFGMLYAQKHLPLNPDEKGSLAALGYKDSADVTHDGADTGL